MNVDVVTVYVSIIASSLITNLIAWVTAVLQLPSLLIGNHYVSKYYQMTISIISDLFQIYLLCCIPVYCLNYKWESNLTVAVVSLIIITLAVFTSIAQEQKNHSYADEIEVSLHKAHTFVRTCAPIPIYIILFCMPQWVWEAPVAWFVNACSWILNIPIIGFIVKLLALPIAGYYLIMAIIGLGTLIYASYQKVRESLQIR